MIVAVWPAPAPSVIVICLPTSESAFGFVSWCSSEMNSVYFIPVWTPWKPLEKNVFGTSRNVVTPFQVDVRADLDGVRAGLREVVLEERIAGLRAARVGRRASTCLRVRGVERARDGREQRVVPPVPSARTAGTRAGR